MLRTPLRLSALLIALAFFPSNDDLTDFMTKTLAAIPGILKAETNIILKPVRSLFPASPVSALSRGVSGVRA